MKRLALSFLLIPLFFTLAAQDSSRALQFKFSGYVSNNYGGFKDSRNYYNLDNRLNFSLGNKYVNLNLTVRNMFFIQNSYYLRSWYFMMDNTIPAYIDLSYHYVNDKRTFLFYSLIDQMNIHCSYSGFDLTIGRQTFDWSMNNIFTPNDLFTTYSFFDYDEPQKLSFDAIDMKYNFKNNTILEFAVSRQQKFHSKWIYFVKEPVTTLAFRLNTKIKNFKLQLISGIYQSIRYAAGMGWSGTFGNFSWTGEITSLWYKNSIKFSNLIASTGIKYSSNKFTFLTEFLYNKEPADIFSFPPLEGSYPQYKFYFLQFIDQMTWASRYGLSAKMEIKPCSWIRFTTMTVTFPEKSDFFAEQKIMFFPLKDLSISLIGQYYNWPLLYYDVVKKYDNPKTYGIFLNVRYKFDKKVLFKSKG